jgi:peptidoglycan/LPS O-acetylase OafA/YrhL
VSEVPHHKTGLKYRPDIDGLRAVAVLSVFGFHMDVKHVMGGFVGVDVFFVISGFLISAIVFSEIAGSRFSVLNFYERRIRRIFPALFGMLLLFSLVLSFYLLPPEFVEFAKSVIAAATSCSNFYFAQHSGYFDSQASPLLHTWSLAVEEQFYILFPIFLVIVRRFFPNRLRISVVVLFFLSLAASIITVFYKPGVAFYMPYTRAWELLLGTIISLGMFPRLNSRWTREIATLMGMGLILLAVNQYSKTTPFPGMAAIVPCLGSALVIGAGGFGPSIVSRVLSWRPIVFVGLISYSLYLWHWPVIILHGMSLPMNLVDLLPDRIAAHLPALRYDKVSEIVISMLLAVLSWKFVEQPFRKRPLRISRRPLFALSAATVALLLAFSGTVIAADGMPGRFPAKSVELASFLDKQGSTILGDVGNCFVFDSGALPDQGCLRLVKGKQNYLLLGDSEAGALWTGLKDTLPAAHVMLSSMGSCHPLLHPAGNAACREEMDFIFQHYMLTNPIQFLLLEARWTRSDMDGLGETIAWAHAHNIQIVVFGPVAEYDAPLPRMLAYSVAWNKPGLANEHRLAFSATMDSTMEHLAKNVWHVPYVSLYKAICESNDCIEYADAAHDVPLMDDSHHLNEFGSRAIAARLQAKGELRFLENPLDTGPMKQ